MSFCADGCLTGITETEKQRIFSRIRRMLGAPVMQVELLDEQIEECICISIEEYSSMINTWVMINRLGEMLGLPSEIDFTLKYVSNSIYFEKSFTKSFGEQAGLGANGTREMKTDFIVLTAGTQNYTIPTNREVNEVLWFTPSFMNLFGLDPFSPQNFAVYEFGASYAGNNLYAIMPVYDTLLSAQAAELRNRVRGYEYNYILRPGPAGTKVLKLLPIPTNSGSSGATVANNGHYGTPGVVFYNYYDSAGPYGNSDYSGTTANPGLTGSTSGITGNGLVSTPADAQLNYITFDQLNSVAQTWVKKYALALATELLGKGIRGKFNGELPIPGAQLNLNKEDLISTGREDQKMLKEQLIKDLEELRYDKIMERRISMQENVNKTLSYGPTGIWVG